MSDDDLQTVRLTSEQIADLEQLLRNAKDLHELAEERRWRTRARSKYDGALKWLIPTMTAVSTLSAAAVAVALFSKDVLREWLSK